LETLPKWPTLTSRYKYLENVLKEANRLAGPTAFLFDRTPQHDIMVGDLPIRKGTILNYAFKTNFFEANYFDDPFAFRPERWDEPRYKEHDCRA
jgi:cytochrome P450